MNRYGIAVLSILFFAQVYAQKETNAYDFLNSLLIEKIDKAKLGNSRVERKACRNLLAQYHPDKNKNKPEREREKISNTYIDITNACDALNSGESYFSSYTADPSYSSSRSTKKPNPTPYKPKTVDRNEALRKAVESGNYSDVKNLLKQGARPNATKDLLHKAVRAAKPKTPDILKALLEAGAPVNGRDYSWKTPVDIALEFENLEELKVLIRAGGTIGIFDINKRDYERNNNSLLHKMVLQDKREWVKILIKLGAHINLANKWGSTPLHDAQSVEVAQMLIDAGADVYAQTNSGKTPFDDARNKAVRELLQRYDDTTDKQLISEIKSGNLVKIKELIKTHEIKLNEPAKRGRLFISYAESQHVLDLLISLGADINARDKFGRTALDRALFDKNLNKARMLLNLPQYFFFSNLARKEWDWGLVKKFMMSEKNYDAKTAQFNFEKDHADDSAFSWLHKIVERSDAEWLEVLLKAGAHVNIKDSDGRTPLHYVRSLPVAELLIEAGADLDAHDNAGKMPIDTTPSVEVRDLLIKEGITTTLHGVSIALADALEKDNIVAVKSILETYSVELNQPDRKSNLLLSYASSSKAVEMLIAAGVNINARDSKSLTALDNALIQKNLKKARALLGLSDTRFISGFASGKVREYGAKTAHIDLETYNQSTNGNTWLHQAVLEDNLLWIELLIAAGAQVNTPNNFKSTPLHDVRSVEAAKLLIAAGADLNAQSDSGKTPLDDVKDSKIRELLIEEGITKAKDGVMTALTHALENNNSLKAQELLSTYSLDLNQENRYGKLAVSYVRSREMLELLLAAGADINAQDAKGRTPLDNMLLEENFRRAQVLLKIPECLFKRDTYGAKTAYINLENYKKNSNGNTYLHQAVLENHITWIKILIAAGAQVNTPNNFKSTPLHDVRSVEAAQLLIAAGADFNAKSKSGRIPLDDAKDPAIRELLIEEGVTKTKGGVATALAYALEKDALEKIKLLLANHRIDLNQVNREGRLLVSYAVSREALELLISSGANINKSDSWGNTALDNAFMNKDLIKARLLLCLPERSIFTNLAVIWNKFKATQVYDCTAKLHSVKLEKYNKTKNGNTWLHQAVLENNLSWIELLIAAGAQVNTQNNFGSTPLHEVQSLEAAQMLTDAGASLAAVSGSGKLPYDDVKNQAVRDYLIEKSISVLPDGPLVALVNALKKDDSARARDILARYTVDLNKPDRECNVPVFYVTSSKNLELLLQKAKSSINARDCHGRTVLDRALIDRDLDKACLLLGIPQASLLDKVTIFKWLWHSQSPDYGARMVAVNLENMHRGDGNNNSWLHVAVLANDIPWIKVLIAAGANVNAQNKFGSTPLHDVQSVEAAELLIRAGANLHALSQAGKAPLDDARTEAIRGKILEALAKTRAQKLLKSEL